MQLYFWYTKLVYLKSAKLEQHFFFFYLILFNYVEVVQIK